MKKQSWAAGFVILCAALPNVSSQAAEGTESQFSIVDVRTSGGEFEQILPAHAAKAQALGQKPFVYLWADWCPPCVALRRSLKTDAAMRDAFAGTYIIQLDIDRWGRKLRAHATLENSDSVFL